MSNIKKIVIVDDHPLVRRGLREIIDEEDDLHVCAEAANVADALSLVSEHKPELVTIDISLEDSNGLELVKELAYRYPELRTLVVSMHKESLFAERVLRAGAQGYITKREVDEVIVSAIRKVLSGNIYLSDDVSSGILRKFAKGAPQLGSSPIDCLSDRELEVMQLIGSGLRTREIAEKLSLSKNTIDNYRAHIKEKLNLKNGAELVQYAVRWVEMNI